jgi:hypothetical protein
MGAHLRRWEGAGLDQRISQLFLCGLWLGAAAILGGYSIHQGAGSDQMFLSMLVGSMVTLGAYDTRQNQPTHYNLLRSWPFGSAQEDEARGRQTLASHALHGMLWVSVWLCLCQILFGHR